MTVGCRSSPEPVVSGVRAPESSYLSQYVRVTHGGTNAEAYWSFDETKLIFQATRGTLKADQIYIMNDDGSDLRMVSTGFGPSSSNA